MAFTVFSASMFEDILAQRTRTAEVYEKVPMGSMSAQARGLVLTEFLRRLDANSNADEAVLDALKTKRSDGKLRNYAMYDWRRNKVRVRAKRAQLRFNKHLKLWGAYWSRVKFALPGHREEDLFDELRLALYTPVGIYTFMHDGTSRISRHGVQESYAGSDVVIPGPSGEENWTVALECILAKIKQISCIRHFPFDSQLVSEVLQSSGALVQDKAYQGTPLAQLSSPLRSQILQEIAFAIDSVAASTHRSKQSGFDWLRKDVRVKFHQAQLIHDRSTGVWRVHFHDIRVPPHSKQADANVSFDDLQLGIYSPYGLHIYRHDMVFGVSTVGKMTAACGKLQVQIYASKAASTWQAALAEILRKLDADDNGCERLAVVPWVSDAEL